jgi:tRNA threonylcarbamoyladenosine biosynthesis protein TsaB
VILLAIDTSTRYAGVAVLGEGDKTAERAWRSEQNHGVELMPAVIDVLARLRLTPKDVTHIAVARGPGGFSAVRVGISAAIGLALPRDLPTLGVTTYDIEAAPYIDRASSSSPLYALIPAGRNEVAWARYESDGPPVSTGLATPHALLAEAPQTARFCGEGAVELSGHADQARLLSGAPPTRAPVTLARLAMARFQAGAKGHATLQPLYARQPSITTPRPPV